MPEEVKINDAFMDFLNSTPGMLEKFFDVLKEFAKIQTNPKVSGPQSGGGPPEDLTIGGTPAITTVELSHQELDELSQGMGEAQKREKAIEWAKGFITGLMVMV